jgi:hypothetical protein
MGSNLINDHQMILSNPRFFTAVARHGAAGEQSDFRARERKWKDSIRMKSGIINVTDTGSLSDRHSIGCLGVIYMAYRKVRGNYNSHASCGNH